MDAPPRTVAPDDVPRLTARVAHQRVAGETVVLDVERLRLLGLNESGGFVWEQIDGARTVRDIAGRLGGRYGIDPSLALEQTVALLRKLCDRNLVTFAPAGG
jgi:pyrroloquinoline quinone biosynthesis protein D